MKPQYKPERQLIDERTYFCHGKCVLGHKDVIMKSFKELSELQSNESSSGVFTYPLTLLRNATTEEIKAYCQKKA